MIIVRTSLTANVSAGNWLRTIEPLRGNWTIARASFPANWRSGVEEFVAKMKRLSVEQIVVVLKQAELGMVVSDVIRQMEIRSRLYYRWRKQYAAFSPIRSGS